jgi:hypothetical protein
MIYMSRSYEENILEENKHYAVMVDSLISTGDIPTKYKMLLDTNDIVNIVMLSFLSIQDKITLDMVAKGKLKQGEELFSIRHPIPTRKYNIKNISKLFGTLPTDIKERLCFSIGLNMMVGLGLDELE